MSSSTLTSQPISPGMGESASVALEIRLAADQARRLSQMAQVRRLSEEEVIERALDLLFTLAALFDDLAERRAWQRLSEAALYRVWDNEHDAVYDHWRELYGVSEG